MSGFKDQVLRVCQKGLFLDGCGSPEKKNHRLLPVVQEADDAICELLPALIAMREGMTPSHRKYRVEKQNTLISPPSQITLRFGHVDSQIGPQFLENVLKARRLREKFIWNSEAQSNRLPRAMIRVLSKDHDFDLIVVDLL